MLNAGKLEALTKGKTALYRLTSDRDLEHYNKLRGLEEEEVMVFQIIKAAGNKGVWTRDLKYKTGLQQNKTKFAKVLKNLERKRLIKSCRTVAAKNKKIYILFDLEPARELRGGAWYTDGEFDLEFISTIPESIQQYYGQGQITPIQAVDVVTKSNLIKTDVDLTAEDMAQILDALCYDGKMYKVKNNSDEFGLSFNTSNAPAEVTPRDQVYKTLKSRSNFNTSTDTPCGVCPVFDQCIPGGLISPSKCPYLKNWLDQM
eukprot:GSMAST32.ASY1.ANO1.1846.1 assembled CDS